MTKPFRNQRNRSATVNETVSELWDRDSSGRANETVPVPQFGWEARAVRATEVERFPANRPAQFRLNRRNRFGNRGTETVPAAGTAKRRAAHDRFAALRSRERQQGLAGVRKPVELVENSCTLDQGVAVIQDQDRHATNRRDASNSGGLREWR